jgi:signal transduction histidine kinase/CheY-like chemotaxis protein
MIFDLAQPGLQWSHCGKQFAIWRMDLVTGEIEMAHGPCRLLNEKASPKSLNELVSQLDPADRVRLLAAVEISTELGQTFDIEYRVSTPRATALWLRDRAAVERDERTGRPRYLVGATQDISSQKEIAALSDQRNTFLQKQSLTMAALSRSSVWKEGDRSALFRSITEMGAATLSIARVSVWLYDSERKKIALMDLYDATSGQHSDGFSIERSSNLAYFEAIEAERFLSAPDACSDPRTNGFAEGYLRPLGIASMLDASVRVLGQTVGVVCCEHVGEVRQWHPEEEVFCGALADLVTLAIELAERRRLEQQLLQVQKMESVGRLAGGVAHDFNNLLTIVKSSVEMARLSSAGSDETLMYLEEISESAQRAADLTAQLLAFARRRLISPKKVLLNDLIEHSKRMLGRVVSEDIELRTVLDESLWHVQFDPAQFDQILMNLSVNACHAMARGGQLKIETSNKAVTTIRASQQSEMKPGDYVLLSVSDTGTGIPADVLPHIFEPFYSSKDGEGTGLGLATCYGIVMQAAGHVFVTTELGKGTTFELYFPRFDGPSNALPAVDAKSGKCSGTETVLVVEDDNRVRATVSAGLRNLGYTVLAAAGGDEAVAFAIEHRRAISILVTDVVMPTMSGKDVSVAVSKLIPGIATLFVSGYAETAIVSNGRLDEGINFLVKPFTPMQLAQRIRQIIDNPASA